MMRRMPSVFTGIFGSVLMANDSAERSRCGDCSPNPDRTQYNEDWTNDGGQVSKHTDSVAVEVRIGKGERLWVFSEKRTAPHGERAHSHETDTQ
jgi:hypothetical protein